MTPPDATSPAGAGQSALREYERRRTARRDRATERYGAVGALITSLTADPRHIEAWKRGARGELLTALELQRHLRRTDVIVLHDRRIPGRGRANIDHLAIGPGGITVIDSKAGRGPIQLTTAGVLHTRELLLVNGQDRTGQLDAVERQINRVRDLLARDGIIDVPVLGALCYPNMRRGLLHANRARGGLITVDDPRHIAKLANRTGPLLPADITTLAEHVAAGFRRTNVAAREAVT